MYAMHVYEGIEHIHKFGSVVNAVADTAVEVWDGGGAYPFPTTPTMTHIRQTADEIALRGATITIQGLDSDWEYVEQSKTLDGTNSSTLVAIDTPLLRVNRMFVVDDVTMLAETVQLVNAGVTEIYADLQIDHNQTLNAIFSVPAGHTGYITGFYADYVPITNKDPESVHFHAYQKQVGNSQGRRVIESWGIPKGAGNYTREFGSYIHIPEKTDIWINCTPNSQPAHVHASFDILLAEGTFEGQGTLHE